MITCPNCKHKEMPGALFCSKCATQLVIAAEESTTSVIETAVIDNFQGEAIPPFPPPPADAADSIAALHILSEGTIIHIRGRNVFTLGRSTKGQTILPDIDLNAYQAYEAGVSRLHANINVSGSTVTIQDLGSANGTRLNGERIEPHEEHVLNHGDILTFGQFKIQILIKE
jgi:hypothetical protein